MKSPIKTSEYTAAFMFCGLGAGALGFLQAQVCLFGRDITFRSLGGIDIDPDACRDFEYLTDSPATCADIATMKPVELRAIFGQAAPDVIFLSAPCKGYSSNISEQKSLEEHYQQLNQLALQCVELIVATWVIPPKLILFENVPRIQTRGKTLLNKVRKILNGSGFVCHGGTHNCGKIAKPPLPQSRERYLLIARHQAQVPSLLYEPTEGKLPGIGSVLELLPLPEDPDGGPLHLLPEISWKTWVRIALIPAGGDWRDLPESVAIATASRTPFNNIYKVHAWDEYSGAVTGGATPGRGGVVVADPRLTKEPKHKTAYKVVLWDKPLNTITTNSVPGGGTFTVADPRYSNHDKKLRNGILGVNAWDQPAPTVTGRANPTTGAFSVQDPRLRCEPRNGVMGVLSWKEAAKTIIGDCRVDNSTAAVADPRIPDDWDKPTNGRVIIVSEDGTWHRPLTILELAALQGIPTVVKEQRLRLAGNTKEGWRERIGNAVPVPAAKAIAEQMLITLTNAEMGNFMHSGTGKVWVDAPENDQPAIERLQ